MKQIHNTSLDTLMLCAFRYSCGRQTYMPLLIREELMNYWEDVSEHTKEQIKNEIITDKHDLNVWQEVLNRDT